MFGSLKKKQEVDKRWQEIDDRSRMCYEDIEAIGAELRAAAMVLSAVPLQIVTDDDSVVIKAKHLHAKTHSIAHAILFVDDDENNRKAFEYAFRDEFHVYTAASGAEALRVLDQQNIGVMVTDHKMPEMTGVELCKIVKRRFPEVIRMIISAYASTDAVIEACNEAQIRCFVRKPWEHERLVRMLNDALTPDAEAMTIIG